MRSYIFYILTLSLIPSALYSQEVQLERQVIGSRGQSFQSTDLLISSTIGQSVTGTVNSGDNSIAQGFQQPAESSVANITYEVSIKNETCPDTQDGELFISNLDGCDGGNYQIEWETGETGPMLSALSAGWYRFQITACGRVITDSAQVGLIYEYSCQLKFYTAFSPNNDEVNDTWIIDNITSEPNAKNEVVIFNRWGDEVKSFVNYNNVDRVWDGKNENGKEVTVGTYYYVAKIKNQSYTGYIEVTR